MSASTARRERREVQHERWKRAKRFELGARLVAQARFGRRRGASAWHWVVLGPGAWWLRGGISFEKHETLANKCGRSKRWSMEQKKAMLELGIVDVEQHYRRCKSPKEHGPRCLCNRSPRNPESRANDYSPDCDALERQIVELGLEAELARELARIGLDDVTSSSSSDGDADASSAATPAPDAGPPVDERIARARELVLAAYSAKLPTCSSLPHERAPLPTVALLVTLGKHAGRGVASICAAIEQARMLAPASATPDELRALAIRYVRAQEKTATNEAPPQGAAAMRAERPPAEPPPRMTPRANVQRGLETIAAITGAAIPVRAPPE